MPNTCYMLYILAFTHVLLSFWMLHDIWRCIGVARFDLSGNARAFIAWNEWQNRLRAFSYIYQHLLIIAILEPMGIFLIRLIMKKNEKNDELQSRREFFKKAAKGALPILGAIALAGAPGVVKAAEEAMDCNYSCSYSCSNSCRGNCYGGCSGSCGGACSYSCQNTCKGSCQGRCSGGCSSMNSF